MNITNANMSQSDVEKFWERVFSAHGVRIPLSRLMASVYEPKSFANLTKKQIGRKLSAIIDCKRFGKVLGDEVYLRIQKSSSMSTGEQFWDQVVVDVGVENERKEEIVAAIENSLLNNLEVVKSQTKKSLEIILKSVLKNEDPVQMIAETALLKLKSEDDTEIGKSAQAFWLQVVSAAGLTGQEKAQTAEVLLQRHPEIDVFEALTLKIIRKFLKVDLKDKNVLEKVALALDSILNPSVNHDVTLPNAKEHFDVRYEDPGKVVEEFCKYLDSCAAEYKKTVNNGDNTYHSPYFAVVQSSGYGKTRLIQQVSLSRPLLYVCLRNETSKGYPPRSSSAWNALFLSNQTEPVAFSHGIERMLYACVEYAVHSRKRFNKTNQAMFSGGGEEMWKDIRHLERRLDKDPGKWPILKCDGNENQPLLTFVFDEARELFEHNVNGVSYFRALRTALREVSVHILSKSATKGIAFGILVDTHSEISNFHPTVETDHSLRPNRFVHTEPLKLFHPFILRLSFDCFENKAGSNGNDWLWYGRALVAMNAKNTAYLVQKLLHGAADVSTNLPGCLAIVLARLGAHVCPQSKLANQLVSGHMVSLLAVNHDHSECLVKYVSEPALAAAAATRWKPKQLKNMLLPALISSLVSGAVTGGYTGELTAQLMLLFAYDTLLRENPEEHLSCGAFLPLLSYLHCLFPGLSLNELRENHPPSLQDGYIALTHFVPLDDEPDKHTLDTLLKRRAAASMPRNQRGVDLIIPVADKNNCLIGALLVQAKNLQKKKKDPRYPLSATKSMDPIKVFKNGNDLASFLTRENQAFYVPIYLQVGWRKKETKIETYIEDGRTWRALVMFGIVCNISSKKNTNKSIVQLLQGVANSWNDFQQYIQENIKHNHLELEKTKYRRPLQEKIDMTDCIRWPFFESRHLSRKRKMQDKPKHNKQTQKKRPVSSGSSGRKGSHKRHKEVAEETAESLVRRRDESVQKKANKQSGNSSTVAVVTDFAGERRSSKM